MGGAGGFMGPSNSGSAKGMYVPEQYNSRDLLTQTGGAPLLASIAMGADVEQTLASYFGKNNYKAFEAGLNNTEKQQIDGVRRMLLQVQSNTQLRNDALSKVVADFPNIAKYAAQERLKSGQEFDEGSKAAMQYALDSTASKYAANGGLSSGAANEAFARVGAENYMNKLGYMGDREQYAYNTRLNDMNARLGEVNALRDFQNIMLGQTAQNGFSAQQAALQRQLQGQMQNSGINFKRAMIDQENDSDMMGAVGGLAGGVIGTYFGGPMGGMAGSSIGSMAGKQISGAGKKQGSSGGGFSSPLLNFGGFGGSSGTGVA